MNQKEFDAMFANAVSNSLTNQSMIKSNNTRIGTVVNVYADNTADVKITSETSTLSRIPLPIGCNGVHVGNRCLIVSPDSKNLNISFISAVYSSSVPAFDVDVLSTIDDAWLPFTPVWTNLTVGNGTQVAACKVIGTTVLLRAKLTFGSTTSVSGTIGIVLPFTVKTGAYNNIGHVLLLDSGGVNTEGVVDQSGILVVMTASGTYVGRAVVNATVPHTWATGDSIQLYATYETE